MMVDPSLRERVVYEKLADEFNRTHPDIRLRIIWTKLTDKMHLLTAADALPDLIPLADFWLANYSDTFLNLDNYLKRDPDKAAQFYPQLLEACHSDGQLKMLPTFFNVPLLYYRPDLFRAAGIPEPTDNWTWDDLRRAAKILTKRKPDGRTEIWGTRIELAWWVDWLGYIRQAGGDLLDNQGNVVIGTPATATAVRFMHAIFHEDRSAPLPREGPVGGFMSGRYAMVPGGHVTEWITLRESAKFEWDIAPLPAGPGGRNTGDFAVAGYGIWKKAKNPDDAWAVLNFLTSKSAGLELCRAGCPPVRKDVAAEEFLAGTPATRTDFPKHREALIRTLEFAHSVPKQKNFSALSSGIVNPLIQRAVLNPDPKPIDGIEAKLARDCTNFLATLANRPTVSPRNYLIGLAILILAAISLALVRRSLGKNFEGKILTAKERRFREGREGEDKASSAFSSRTFASFAMRILHFVFVARSKPLTEQPRAGTERWFYFFISPWLIGVLALTVGPMLMSLYWSMTRYNLTSPPEFVGFSNYSALVTKDPYFWHSLKITLIYACFAAPITLAMGLFTALLLNRNSRGMGFFRTLFYLPSILPVAASGLMWLWVFNPQFGMLNRGLKLLGIAGPGWLYDPKWALPSLIIISLWGFGGGMLICLAGLKAIPTSLYEAASIDGATSLRQFFHVTLPSLSPVLFFNLTMALIGAMQIFDVAYIVGTVGPGLGEPQRSTYFYVLNLYEKSFVHLNLGLGSAMAWILFVLILCLTLLNFGLKKYWVFSETETR